MAKLTLTDIAAGYALISTINANNALLEAALENTLSRDGTTPNTMSADLDMNSQNINNLADPANDSNAANKGYVDTQISAAATLSAGTVNEATAYDFTNQIDFSGAGGIRVRDPSETDSMQIAHDGDNIDFSFVNTVDVNFGALTAGEYRFNDNLFVIGNTLSVYQLDEASSFAFTVTGDEGHITGAGNITNLNIATFDSVQIAAPVSIEGNNFLVLEGATGGIATAFSRAGIAELRVTSTTAGDTWNLRDGPHIRILDDGDTDYVQLDHDGTDFNVTGFQTTDMNFTGMVGLNFASTNIGFYGTAPIAQQTGVAVSAGGIHAALVALGLITA